MKSLKILDFRYILAVFKVPAHRIKLENEPINISLDPNLLVLMNNSIKKIEIK